MRSLPDRGATLSALCGSPQFEIIAGPELAGRRLMKLSNLVESIDTQRHHGNHTSATRLFDLDFYRNEIPEAEGSETLRVLMARPKPLLF